MKVDLEETKRRKLDLSIRPIKPTMERKEEETAADDKAKLVVVTFQ